MLRRALVTSVLIAVGALFMATSCKHGAGNKNGENGVDTGKPAFTSKGDEGSITGKISFNGTAPAPKKIDMGQDSYCVGAPGEKTTEDVAVANGKLANVFVYVKSGGAVDKYSFPAPATD